MCLYVPSLHARMPLSAPFLTENGRNLCLLSSILLGVLYLFFGVSPQCIMLNASLAKSARADPARLSRSYSKTITVWR